MLIDTLSNTPLTKFTSVLLKKLAAILVYSLIITLEGVLEKSLNSIYAHLSILIKVWSILSIGQSSLKKPSRIESIFFFVY